jgi:hypothetical protein
MKASILLSIQTLRTFQLVLTGLPRELFHALKTKDTVARAMHSLQLALSRLSTILSTARRESSLSNRLLIALADTLIWVVPVGFSIAFSTTSRPTALRWRASTLILLRVESANMILIQ